MTTRTPQLVSFGGLSAGFDSSIFADDDRFQLWAPARRLVLEGISKGSKTRPKLGRIVGIATSETQDEDDDIIDQEGLEWDYFIGKGGTRGNGLIILEHPVGVMNTIGFPVSIKLTEITSELTGKLVKATEVTADLYLEDRWGKKVYRKGRVMQRAGGQRRPGFSIEGGVKERRGRRVTKGRVKWLAVTMAPRNHDSWWFPKVGDTVIQKSDVGYPMQGVPYEGAISPLVAQSLQGRSGLSRDEAVMMIAKSWPQKLTWANAELVFDQFVNFLARKSNGAGVDDKDV